MLPQTNPIISGFSHLSSQQLLDTAEYYFEKNSMDTALACYGLLINTPVKDKDFLQHQKIIEAYSKSAIIHIRTSDFRTAYELLIKALLLSEKSPEIAYESRASLSRIFNSFGVIYSHYKKYDLAKQYYVKALDLCQDSAITVMILSNMGGVETRIDNQDRAYYYLNKALKVSERNNNAFIHSVLNSLAYYYKENQEYDSAIHYFQLSWAASKKNNVALREADNLSQLARCFFEKNKIDSALVYLNMSNVIAKENSFLGILAENYLTMSKIEESKGRTLKAFEYHKKYADLKDSIFNAEKFGDIHQLQHMYETSKTNQQIEQLRVEQEVKEKTIYFQTIIQRIILSILVLVCVVLIFVFFQKRKLNTAYTVLVEKNREALEFHKNTSEKYKNTSLAFDMQTELLDKILVLMDNTSVICDAELSIDKLAELVQSNRTYVSQAINNVLKKSFNQLLSEYRIREAQRLFSEPDAEKYTIDFVALKTGFKSRSAFYTVFKKVTGVSPYFYLKSIHFTSSLTDR